MGRFASRHEMAADGAATPDAAGRRDEPALVTSATVTARRGIRRLSVGGGLAHNCQRRACWRIDVPRDAAGSPSQAAGDRAKKNPVVVSIHFHSPPIGRKRDQKRVDWVAISGVAG